MSIKFSEVPSHLEIERRYIVSEPNLRHPALAMARPVGITQTYLGPIPGWRGYSRVRESKVGGVSTYEWASKKKLSALTKRESEAEINKPTYEWLLGFANERPVTSKTRRRFQLNGLVFELDKVHGEDEHWLLEVELESEEQEVTVPSFITVEREITFEGNVPTE